MNDASNPSPDKSPRIIIEGSVEEPSQETLLTYVGRIVHVVVGVPAGAGWTPLGDLFRFARVVAVHPRTPETSICAHCDQEARSAVDVLWESGVFTPSKTICECCIDGVVTSGMELIDFPPDTEINLKSASEQDRGKLS
jgi:hypothetical protein